MDAPWWTFGPFLGLVFLTSLTGAIFRPGSWYAHLEKPSWTPPDWLFPVAWAGLYLTIAIAGWRIWDFMGVGLPLVIWAFQLILNAAWSAIFFGLRSPLLALVEVLALWLSIVAMIITFAMVDLNTGLLLLPYLAWVSFAAALNLAIVRRRLGVVEA